MVVFPYAAGAVPAGIPDILSRQAQWKEAPVAAFFGPVCSEGLLYKCE